MKVQHDIAKEQDKNGCVELLLLDLSAAFDYTKAVVTIEHIGVYRTLVTINYVGGPIRFEVLHSWANVEIIQSFRLLK